ncbi:hypothetical protein BJ944DRAFT_270492 [Cunninghamella echinulata]|nr:hypothetical protein BJ944DRAFT_270492 [Cunninghamella echinulata]
MNITDDDDNDDNGDDNNNDNEKERYDTALDDSIWDIAKADIGKRPFDLSQKRNKQVHAKTLVTYSRKDKDKNMKKILPPELTKPNNRSSSHRPSSIPPTKKKTTATVTDGTIKPSTSSLSPSTTVLNPTIASSSLKGPIVEIPSPPSTEETPAQVLKRLTTETNEPPPPPPTPITKKDKGKGRAIDSLPSTSITTIEEKKTTSKRPSLSLNKNKNNSDHHDKSLQKEKEASKNTSIATTSSFSISSPPSLSSNNNNNNHSRSMNHYQPPSFLLAQSTPISSRIDNGDTDLFKLTLSPIRHAGASKTITTTTTNTTNRQHHGVFDNLNTPIMGDLRVQQYGSDELEIQKQIANRFRNKKRPLSPTTQHDDTNKNKDNKYSLFDEEESPLSSILTPSSSSSSSNPIALTNNNNNTLTENELKMTVEEFIHHLVEKKINLVQQHGESLIKSIEEEVRNTRNSILTNQ